MGKIVLGSYDSQAEVVQILNQLTENGIPSSSIAILANEEHLSKIARENEEISRLEAAQSSPESHNLLNRVEALFSLDGLSNKEDESQELDLSHFKDEVDQGKIFVLVDESFEAEAMKIK